MCKSVPRLGDVQVAVLVVGRAEEIHEPLPERPQRWPEDSSRTSLTAGSCLVAATPLQQVLNLLWVQFGNSDLFQPKGLKSKDPLAHSRKD